MWIHDRLETTTVVEEERLLELVLVVVVVVTEIHIIQKHLVVEVILNLLYRRLLVLITQ